MVRIWIEAWQMQCCGDAFAVGSEIRWHGFPEPDGGHLATLIGTEVASSVTHTEERHSSSADLEPLVGLVTGIAAVFGTYAPSTASSRMLLPVEGSGILQQRDRATGWEDETSQHFVGYIVDLEPSVQH